MMAAISWLMAAKLRSQLFVANQKKQARTPKI